MEKSECEFQDHNKKLEQLLGARDDGEHIIGLFADYDRGGLGRRASLAFLIVSEILGLK